MVFSCSIQTLAREKHKSGCNVWLTLEAGSLVNWSAQVFGKSDISLCAGLQLLPLINGGLVIEAVDHAVNFHDISHIVLHEGGSGGNANRQHSDE